MSTQHSSEAFPNVGARLRLYRTGPALPPRETFLQIWMKGTRFRVRDESGRRIGDILGDITRRGLGAVPRSIEAIMDIHSEARDTAGGAGRVTELYGDLATNEGWVRPQGEAAWPIPAAELAPVARMILAGDVAGGLERRADVTRLGRPCRQYYGILEGEEDGLRYRSEATYIISAPYLIASQIRDARDTSYTYLREIVALDEGGVADADVAVP